MSSEPIVRGGGSDRNRPPVLDGTRAGNNSQASAGGTASAGRINTARTTEGSNQFGEGKSTPA